MGYKHVKAWRERNRDKDRYLDREYKRTRRDPLFKLWWPRIKDHYGNACVRCGKTGKLCMDHVVPILWAGLNELANFQPLCVSCNSGSDSEGKDRDFRSDRGQWIVDQLGNRGPVGNGLGTWKFNRFKKAQDKNNVYAMMSNEDAEMGSIERKMRKQIAAESAPHTATA